jgi:nickel-dependent lactate racemase
MGSGAASLIGTSLLTRWGWARPTVADGTNTVTVRTHEHYGDIEEQLAFPDAWELEVLRMKGHGQPGLTPGQLRDKLNHPVGTAPLKEIAAGRKTAVITFDDLTRPTLIKEIIPLLVDDLRAAGLSDKNILFLSAHGSHRAMTHAEARVKLGDTIVNNFAWVNHNPWDNLLDVGVTSRGNRIRINYLFVKADLRITISGVKGHNDAGYGGGGKAVLPGIAGMESIDYFHRTITGLGTNPSVGLAKVFNNDVRLDMEEAARLTGVDFSVQIIYNERREPIEIIAGDVVTAHHRACHVANAVLRTPTAKNADIVVANAYPRNRQAHAVREWARASLRDGGSAVIIAQHPDAMSTMHYLNERRYHGGHWYWENREDDRNTVPQAAQMIIFSQYMQKRDTDKFSSRNLHLVQSWEEVVNLLQKQHRSDARVALYPYANIQHPEIDLTLPPAA